MKKIFLISVFMLMGSLVQAISMGGSTVIINQDTTTVTSGYFSNLTTVSGTATDIQTATLSASGATATGALTVTGKASASDTLTATLGITGSTATFSGAISALSATVPTLSGKVTVSDTITASKGITTSTITTSAGITVVGITNTGTTTTSGAGGIVNTYGITSSSIALTNSSYAVSIASSATSQSKMYFGGAYGALPTTGFPAYTLIILTSDNDLYLSTETVSGTFSWVAQ